MPCIAADTKTTPSSKMESHFHHGVPAVAETSIGDVITANNATTYAEFDPVTDYCLFEEEESLADDESATAVLESFNDFLISLYIPLLIKSVFGGVYVIRSVILGYAMQYAMRCLSFSEQTAGRWLGTGVKGGAWPPPTLIGLGVLTVVALVVHPDGYTWILLRKLRDGMMILFHSSSTCWAVAVNDYGAIISTLLALSTFSSLFFFAYVLHKTISSRTSEHRLRHQQNSEKQKKKKRKQHGSSARNAKGGGRLRTTEQQRKEGGTLDDNEHAVENLNDYRPIQSDDAVLRTFPPLAEDEPVASLSVPLLGDSVTPSSTTKTSRDESDPLCLPAISTSTLESATNSGDDYLSNGTRSGLSIPTTVVANDVSHLAIGAVLDRRALHITETSRVKAKVNNTGAQNRLPSTNSRRSSRRGKKAAATVDANAAVANASAQAPPASSPSKRWDALKPRSRKCGGRQRLPASAKFRSVRDDPYARFEYDTTSVDSSHSGTNEILMAENRSTSFSPKRDFSFQRLQPPHTHHCASSTDPSMAKTQDSPLISAASATTTALGDQLDGYRNTADQSSPSYLTSTAATGVPVAPFSSLNPQSPSWNDSRSCRLPIRPPPGLETFRNDIPFGCNSSDGGNSAPASPFQSLPSMLDVYHADNTGRLAVPSPFHTDMPTGSPASDFSFLANYEGLYMPPDAAGVSLRFRSPSTPFTVAKQRHLRDNPFATSDEEADEEQIEAELQELGGQMVGSILDF